MKRIKLILFFLFSSIYLIAPAQVAISYDGSSPDATAMFEVKSNTKGVLIPRLSQAQISSITNPANGLIVFNTNDSKLYIFTIDGYRWKEVQYGVHEILYPASFSIGNGNSCSNTVVGGEYFVGISLGPIDTIVIDTYVYTNGNWSVSTNTVNGYSFSGSGVFTSTGNQQITLYGSGTPILSQTDFFTASVTGGGSTCSFNVSVSTLETSEVYNSTTGRIWLDKNLGASQVATSKTDAAAYGSLYQWGRYSEGHQLRTSGNTNNNATTYVPYSGGAWDGLFIKEPDYPYDWLTTQNNTLWDGLNATNNPCPSGFRIPTQAEWEEEMQSWTTNDSDGAYNSELKLTVAGVRSYYDGALYFVGTSGYYWSSTNTSIYSRFLHLSSNATINAYGRVYGMSVRCIKD